MISNTSLWSYTNWYPVTSNGWSAVEVYDQAGTSGSLTLSINGTSQPTLTGINNGTWTITKVQLGAQGMVSTTHGTLYFDSFESRRFSTIGTLLPPDLPPAQVAAQAGWVGNDYAYDPNHPHAVAAVTRDSDQSSLGSYTYDANGNMTCRMESPSTGSGQASWFIQTYNAENRLSVVQKLASGNCTSPGTFAAQWNFSYDGDGRRVAQSYIAYDSNGNPGTPVLTEYFLGGLYEMSGSQVKKYYSIAGMTIAMNDPSAGSGQAGLKYLLTDQLGSVVAMTDSTGTLISQQRYLPFGQVRTDVASPNSPATDLAFTGQRNLDAQGNVSLGLMDYNARMYDSLLARFIQPDNIVSGFAEPQTWNRYAYVLNNPINFIDPTGHDSWWCNGDPSCEGGAPNPGGTTHGNGGNNSSYEPISSGISITPTSCPSCYHTVGTSSQSKGTSSQPNLLDPLSEFSNMTGITPKSACAQMLGSSACNPDNYSINISNSIEFPTPTPQEDAQNLQNLQYGYGFLNDLSNANKFLYTSEGARALDLDPGSDFMIGGLGQAIADDGNPNLSTGQRILRAGAVGLESIGTDLGSLALGIPGIAVGEAVVPEGGGVVGFAVVRLSSSIAIDQVVWGNVNKRLFPAIGAGNP